MIVDLILTEALPLAFAWGMLGLIQLWRYPHQTKRIWSVLKTIPDQLRNAWKNEKPWNTSPDSTIETNKIVYPLPSPSFDNTLLAIQQVYNSPSFIFTYGWATYSDSYNETKQILCFANLDSVYNIAVLGPQQQGKTTLIRHAFSMLMHQSKPQDIQFVFFDCKVLDFLSLKSSPYTFLYTSTMATFDEGMNKIYLEMRRRARILIQEGISTWEEANHLIMPLLIIYISDIPYLSSLYGHRTIDQWITTLMTYSPTFGFRVIVDTPYIDTTGISWYPLLSEKVLGSIHRTHPKMLHALNIDLSTKMEALLFTPSNSPQLERGIFSAFQSDATSAVIRTITPK